MNKFVVISDLHCHPWTQFAKGEGLHNTRLLQTLNVLEQSLRRAKEEQIPWVFAGDLVHTAGYALNSVLAGVVQVLAAYPEVEKIMVWGNHDVRGVGGKITLDQTVLASLAYSVKRLTVLDPSVTAHKSAGGLTFSGAGYQPNHELLEYGQERGVMSDVGVYHQTLAGSWTAGGHVLTEGLNKQELVSRHRLSIVGHIHQCQQVVAVPADKGILIPGSPEQHNFGDDGDHGWWVVSLASKGEAALEFVPSLSPMFCTVETTAEVKEDENFYRIRKVAKGETLPEGALAIAPTPTTVKQRNVLDGASGGEEVMAAWRTLNPVPEGFEQAYAAAGRELLTGQDPTSLRDVSLTRLHLKNFCSFEDQEFTVEDGLWLVTGKGRDYPSNGAGKSTLTGEALYWLLFGRTTKGLGVDEVIRWGENECSVAAVFDLPGGGAQLEVVRRRGRSGSTLVVCEHYMVGGAPDYDGPEWDSVAWEATSVNEMTTKLNQYLGVTPEIFQNLGYFSQKKLLLFSSATDSERKTVLADLVGLSGYQHASEEASRCGKLAETDKAAWVVREESYNEQVEQWTEGVRQRTAVLQKWEEGYQEELKWAQAALEEAHAKKVISEDAWAAHARQSEDVEQAIEARAQELEAGRAGREDEVRAEHNTHNEQAIENKQAVIGAKKVHAAAGFSSFALAHSAVGNIPKLNGELEKTLAEFTELSVQQAGVVQHNIENATGRRVTEQEVVRVRQELQAAEDSLSAGVCPTCDQSITPEHREVCLQPSQQRLTDLDTELREYVARIATAEAELGDIRQHTDKVNTRATTQRTLIANLENVERLCNEVTVLEQELATLAEAAVPAGLVIDKVDADIGAELAKFTAELQAGLVQARAFAEKMTAAHDRGVETAQARLKRAEEEINPYVGEVKTAGEQMEAVVEKQMEAADEVRLAIDKIAIYDYWRTGFSKQGIQSLLMEEIATLFNNVRGDIFPLLTQGVYDVQFSTVSKLRSGELREKTEFVVYEHGKPVPYNALSGGQGRRVDVGIMLVLVKAVSEWMGIHGVLGVLVLDEVFGFLDASGAEGLLAALGQLTEQVRTTYVITHDTHLQSMVPDTIRVEQDADGISKVVK